MSCQCLFPPAAESAHVYTFTPHAVPETLSLHGCDIPKNGVQIMASRAIKIDPKKAVATGSKTQAAITPARDTGNIAVRAYELWLQRGCPIGSPEVDWYQAEREIHGSVS
jgi:hypothetical protein